MVLSLEPDCCTMRRMESPPTYAPPRKKSNTGLIIGLVLGGIAICCIGGIALIFGGGLFLWGKVKGFANCMINYQEVRRAMDAYVEDHDGKLPSAANWQDEVKPYLAKVKMPKEKMGPFNRLDPEGEWGCQPSDGAPTGMAFNASLSEKKITEIKDPTSTILIFEVESRGRNLNEPYKVRPLESSPKMLGDHRGWLEMPVLGPTHMSKNGKMVDLDVNVDMTRH